jgi:hypothetical protein
MSFRDLFRRGPETSQGKTPEKAAEADIVFEEVKPQDEITEREGKILNLEAGLMAGNLSQEVDLDTRFQIAELKYMNAVDKIAGETLRVFEIGESVKVPSAKQGEVWKVAIYNETDDSYTLTEETTDSMKHVDGKELTAWQEPAGMMAYEERSSARRALDNFKVGEKSRAFERAKALARPAAVLDKAGRPPEPTSADTAKLHNALGIRRVNTTDSGREIEIPR